MKLSSLRPPQLSAVCVRTHDTELFAAPAGTCRRHEIRGRVAATPRLPRGYSAGAVWGVFPEQRVWIFPGRPSD